MWLFTKTGFFSAVQKWDEPDVIVVRARVRRDLAALIKKHALEGETRILVFKGTDYPYRLNLSKPLFQLVLADEAAGIDYPNFKDEVKNQQGYPRARLYMEIWRVMYDAEAKLKELSEGERLLHFKKKSV